MRENCTPGSVRGAPGDRRSYRRDLSVLARQSPVNRAASGAISRRHQASGSPSLSAMFVP